MADEERRAGMQTIVTDIELIKQALQTNNEQTAKVVLLLQGDAEVEGLVTKVAVLKSSVFRIWSTLTAVLTIIVAAIIKTFWPE